MLALRHEIRTYNEYRHECLGQQPFNSRVDPDPATYPPTRGLEGRELSSATLRSQ